MDLLELATRLFKDKVAGGAGLDTAQVMQALGSLLGDGRGGLDLGQLVGRLQGGDLAALAQSWLGDGANQPMSPQQVLQLFGDGALGDFAGRLGLERDAAGQGLAAMLPELIDGQSRGGSLLDAVGGVGGLLGAAGKLFK
ncbi:MAG: YidB family protein [Gammaproteobacteria bacterium]